MLTPETSASSTSAPSVIILKARSTQVTPFSSFERLPFAEATTQGLTPFVIIVGPWLELVEGCPKRGLVAAAAATPAAVVVRTKSRRFNFFMVISNLRVSADTLVACRWRVNRVDAHDPRFKAMANSHRDRVTRRCSLPQDGIRSR